MVLVLGLELTNDIEILWKFELAAEIAGRVKALPSGAEETFIAILPEQAAPEVETEGANETILINA